MTVTVRSTVVIALAFVVCGVGIAAEQGLASDPWWGACYCRANRTLECTPNLTERECRRRSDEALCDDWFWKERLPCWNWGYGG